MTVEPFYQDETQTIYHADCRDLLPNIEPGGVSLVLTDPPYGIGVNTRYASAKRGQPSERSTHVAKVRKQWSTANDYPPVAGDDEPFDPRHLLGYRRLVLFGANHYADLLPSSRSWLVWNRESGDSDTADAELAWTNLGGTVRMFSYQWNGACRAGEKDTHGYHPTQKPVALMRWIIERATQPGDLILDPYMGSGPVLAAAKQLGRRAIGIELVEEYCSLAASRLAQEVLDLGGVA